MGWETISLSEVVDSGPKVSTTIEPGPQIVRLLGVKPDKYQPEALAFDLVVDEGGYRNRRLFPTLPDPSKQEWAANAAKHLASTLGITQEPGESVMAMFNRAAQSGTARFQVEVIKETFTKRDGSKGEGNKVQFFTAQATA